MFSPVQGGFSHFFDRGGFYHRESFVQKFPLDKGLPPWPGSAEVQLALLPDSLVLIDPLPRKYPV